MARAFLLLVLVSFVLAGCGKTEKDVTKAQYEQRLDRIGTNLYSAANNLGQSTATGIFNQNVQALQDVIDDSASELDGVRPPGIAAQAQNDRLVEAYRDLADEFDKVKDARRESYPRAIVALTAVQHSEPAQESLRAAAQLRKLGFKVPVSATIGGTFT